LGKKTCKTKKKTKKQCGKKKVFQGKKTCKTKKTKKKVGKEKKIEKNEKNKTKKKKTTVLPTRFIVLLNCQDL